MGQVFSPEFKGQVCKKIVEGCEKVSQVSLDLDIHDNTLHNWVRTYKESNGKPFIGNGNIKPENAEMKRLQRRIKNFNRK